MNIKLQPYLRSDIPVNIQLPKVVGGYLLIAKFTPQGGSTVISRRYLKVGKAEKYSYYNMVLK
ncbi:MAG: hypothetical protein H7X84_07595 [Verrucomicrobia bacterium]|nr:hypothetical protein [Prolixibacteraceae bacterium]